jgi:membrane protease YdiL (CAAX protease family)
MEAATGLEEGRLNSRLIAPRWHTLVVLLIVLGFSALAAVGTHLRSVNPSVQPQRLVVNYTFGLAVEWLTVAFVLYGVRLCNVSFRALIGGRWNNWMAVLRDLGIAALIFLASNLALAILVHFLQFDPGKSIRGLLPRGGAEVALYLLLALTAGFCEEIIFRGYLQRQLTVMLGSPAAAIVGQGILFALFHGNQGWKFAVIIATYGWFLGALAYWRRSVRPGMIAHFAQDGLVGLLAPYLFK